MLDINKSKCPRHNTVLGPLENCSQCVEEKRIEAIAGAGKSDRERQNDEFVAGLIKASPIELYEFGEPAASEHDGKRRAQERQAKEPPPGGVNANAVAEYLTRAYWCLIEAGFGSAELDTKMAELTASLVRRGILAAPKPRAGDAGCPQHGHAEPDNSDALTSLLPASLDGTTFRGEQREPRADVMGLDDVRPGESPAAAQRRVNRPFDPHAFTCPAREAIHAAGGKTFVTMNECSLEIELSASFENCGAQSWVREHEVRHGRRPERRFAFEWETVALALEDVSGRKILQPQAERPLKIISTREEYIECFGHPPPQEMLHKNPVHVARATSDDEETPEELHQRMRMTVLKWPHGAVVTSDHLREVDSGKRFYFAPPPRMNMEGACWHVMVHRPNPDRAHAEVSLNAYGKRLVVELTDPHAVRRAWRKCWAERCR